MHQSEETKPSPLVRLFVGAGDPRTGDKTFIAPGFTTTMESERLQAGNGKVRLLRLGGSDALELVSVAAGPRVYEGAEVRERGFEVEVGDTVRATIKNNDPGLLVWAHPLFSSVDQNWLFTCGSMGEPNPVTRIAACSTVRLSTVPEQAFKPERLFIHSTFTDYLSVFDILVGKNSCLGTGSPIAAAHFSEKNSLPLRLDTIQATQNFSVTLMSTHSYLPIDVTLELEGRFVICPEKLDPERGSGPQLAGVRRKKSSLYRAV